MTPDPIRAEALTLLARLRDDARQVGAGHLLAYLDTHEDAFVAAYAAARGDQGRPDPISPFLYTLT